MYCPQCASAHQEDVKFCRNCGANLSLIEQALSGDLPSSQVARPRRHSAPLQPERAANLGHGITQAFLGLGFLLVSFSVFRFAPGGSRWWFWLLIPAFAILGRGVSEIVNAVLQQKGLVAPPTPTALPNAPKRLSADQHRVHHTGELAPPSVTEGTTRHLDAAEVKPKEKA